MSFPEDKSELVLRISFCVMAAHAVAVMGERIDTYATREVAVSAVAHKLFNNECQGVPVILGTYCRSNSTSHVCPNIIIDTFYAQTLSPVDTF